jgi:hypothetical protein
MSIAVECSQWGEVTCIGGKLFAYDCDVLAVRYPDASRGCLDDVHDVSPRTHSATDDIWEDQLPGTNCRLIKGRDLSMKIVEYSGMESPQVHRDACIT